MFIYFSSIEYRRSMPRFNSATRTEYQECFACGYAAPTIERYILTFVLGFELGFELDFRVKIRVMISSWLLRWGFELG